MKTNLPIRLAAGLLLIAVQPVLPAQTNTIVWHKIAGGGGASTGGTYSITGTFGQSETSGTLSGGRFSMAGGVWNMISVISTPGAPPLTIQSFGTTVNISWPATASYALQQTSDLAGGSWSACGYAVATNNGTNSVSFTPPTGNWYFRLAGL